LQAKDCINTDDNLSKQFSLGHFSGHLLFNGRFIAQSTLEVNAYITR